MVSDAAASRPAPGGAPARPGRGQSRGLVRARLVDRAARIRPSLRTRSRRPGRARGLVRAVRDRPGARPPPRGGDGPTRLACPLRERPGPRTATLPSVVGPRDPRGRLLAGTRGRHRGRAGGAGRRHGQRPDGGARWQAGVATLRYAAAVALPVGVHLWRRRVLRLPEVVWSALLLAVDALFASRLALLMAVVVFAFLHRARHPDARVPVRAVAVTVPWRSARADPAQLAAQ